MKKLFDHCRWFDLLLVAIMGLGFVMMSFLPTYGFSLDLSSYNIVIYYVLFALLVVLTIGYLIYLIKFDNFKVNKLISIVFLVVILENFLVVLFSPETTTIQSVVRMTNEITDEGYIQEIFNFSGLTLPSDGMMLEGTTYPLLVVTTLPYRIFAAMAFTGELILIYSLIFFIPHKFPSLDHYKWFGLGAIIVAGVTILYSYVFEFGKYIDFVKSFFDSTIERPFLESYAGQHNVYAMILLMNMMLIIQYHSYSEKHWLYIPIGFIAFNILLTLSKGGIVTLAIMLGGYLLLRLIKTFKTHKKRNTIISSLIGGIAFLALVMTAISFISGGNKLGFIYEAITGLPTSKTIVTRMNIWQNVFQLLNNRLGWIFGKGFALGYRYLYPMNAINGDPVNVPHNGLLSLIYFGGVFMLIGYLITLIYILKIDFKYIKTRTSLAVTSLIAAFSYLVYSMIESNHLLLFFSFMPILFLYAGEKNNQLAE